MAAFCPGGLLALREIEQRLGIASRVAGCIADPRVPEQVTHQLDEIVRFRMRECPEIGGIGAGAE